MDRELVCSGRTSETMRSSRSGKWTEWLQHVFYVRVQIYDLGMKEEEEEREEVGLDFLPFPFSR